MRADILVGMTSLLLLAPVVLGAPSDVEFRMKIAVNGKPAGTATVRKHINRGGSLTLSTEFKLRLGQVADDMVSTSTYDRSGRPLKETETHASAGMKGGVTKVFGKDRVTIRTDSMNGQSRTFEVPLPKGNIADPSNFWFFAVKPKVGARVDYMRFDVRTRSWQKRYSIYSGDEIVPGTRVRAHAIKSDGATDWVDDQGRSIRTEDHRIAGTALLAVRDGK